VTAPGQDSIDLSLRDARRLALAAQGFATRRPPGRIDRRHFRRVLDQVGTVQLDSVNVLTRSHELVFFARIGDYDRDALTRWLWSSKEVFEYWGHEASLHPVERHPLFRWRMADGHQWGGVRKIAEANPGLLEATLQEVVERGPVRASDLATHAGSPQRTEAWWGWTDGKRMVEYLFWMGQITATRRAAFDRVYMAPDRWLPPELLATPGPTIETAQRALLLIAAQALGVGTARDLADYYRLPLRQATPLLNALVEEGHLLPARVEGWQHPAYLFPTAHLPRRRMRHRALLSPFDSLIWERQRTERLFDFYYRIEIYTPAPKRVHGYYVLPFLLDEELVGRVDLKADRKAGLLRVQAAWVQDGRGAEDRERIAHEMAISLQEMADWLGLAEGLHIEPRGDLVEELSRVT
jgi:hypothetical protein